MDSADGPAPAILTGPLTDDELPADITNEVPALTRIELYGSRPCLFVTTRILVVDMLRHHCHERAQVGLCCAHCCAGGKGVSQWQWAVLCMVMRCWQAEPDLHGAGTGGHGHTA